MNAQTQKFKIRLGLFIAGGLALFIIAIFLIGKQKNLFDPVFKLTTTFYNVSGLQVGSNVRFSGINVGTVDNISIINDSTVRVDMLIKKSVQKFIKTDCEAGIGSAGIIGDRILILTQGSSDAPMIKDGQNIESKEPTETDAIMASLKVTADNAAIISDQLAEIMGKVNNGNGTLWKLIQDSTMANNISQTIVSLKRSSKGLDENMNAAKHNFLLRGFFKDKQKAVQKEEKKVEKAAQKVKDDAIEKKADEQKVIQKEEKKEEKAAQKVKDIATEKKADEQKVIQKEEKKAEEQKANDKGGK
jgi:phospholipid/cholesterol/gamma-HCH transport system substrate-binding protein